MNDSHPLLAEIARLTEIEQRILDRFIHRERVARDITAGPLTFGERLADRVASFGGSWSFIGLALAGISVWMLVNALMGKPFDPYPFILLNLALSCVAALQAPIIMMSQNRQAARDRLDAQHDYEVNTKAELEIVALHAKLDELRDQKWIDLMKLQERQLDLLSKLVRS
jgi:uncharacterized membrane protein